MGSIPIKSALQKKHKGDEHPDDDIEITSVNPGGNQQPVSSEAIEKLLDRKLGLLNCFLQQLHPDLGTFEELVRVEFEGMGLRLREQKLGSRHYQTCGSFLGDGPTDGGNDTSPP